MREMVAGNLREAGYEVREAEDAAGAWKALRASRVDLVLLDWMLPGASGYEFLRRLRREGAPAEREVPVILVTARADEPDRVRGLDAGGGRLRGQALLAARAPGPGPGPPPAGRGRRARTGSRPDGLVVDRESCRVEVARRRGRPRAHRVPPPPLPRLPAPTGCGAAPRSWTTPGATTSSSRSAPWTSRSGGCERPSAPHGVDGYIRTVRGFGYRFSVAG